MEENYQFNFPKNNSNYIKVIGVGGGGCNAVNFMYNEGIKGVDYVVCNTDAQALEYSPISNRIQLGVTLTEGLGAGANPEIGEQAALESIEDIKRALEGNTQMVFITAGMGGGTGTGAVPVIAKQAKDMGILTVAIVTTPFNYEGLKRSRQAQAGIKKLRDCVDSLLVINNNKISEIYDDLTVEEGYGKANEILLKGAKGMAEVISKHYLVNIDLRDARTVLENGGTAIMGSAMAEGDNRAIDAVAGALNSPLLNDNKIVGAKNALVLITYGDKKATQREVNEIMGYIQEKAGDDMADLIYGIGVDESLGDAISVIVIATGFDAEQQQEIVNSEPRRVIHVLEENQTIIRDLTEQKGAVVKTSITANDTTYPTPTVPEIKKELSLSDLFNIWTDCEVVTADDAFVIVDKTAPTQFDDNFQTQSIVKQQPIQQQSIQQSSIQQQPQTKAPDAPIIHTLRDEPYEFSYTTKSPIKEEEMFDMYVRDVEFEEKYAQPIVEKRSQPEFVSNKGSEAPQSYNPNTSVGVQTRMFAEDEEQKLSPMDAPISDVLNKRSSNLKTYNHTFGNAGQSRTTVGKDSAGEMQIRRNNSFLHDNVD